MYGMCNIKCSMLIHPFFPILRPGGVCECSPECVGNPHEACRPEWVLNTECNRDQACIRNKCRDPCPGTCGQNARCDVINHIPTCSCPSGFTGDPFSNCRQGVPGCFVHYRMMFVFEFLVWYLWKEKESNVRFGYFSLLATFLCLPSFISSM